MSRPPGNISPRMIVAAYMQGAFPMAPSRDADAVDWFAPDPRAILPLDQFHCPRSLARTIRQGIYTIRHDTAFEQVMRRCAEPRRDTNETWINEPIVRSFTALHEAGIAHSIEAWRDGELVGGLYGVALGGTFFGESMFHDPDRGRDASKVCLAKTVEHLNARGYTLFDVQLPNPFLARFGVIEIRQQAFRKKLHHALQIDATWQD
jgi:leucyl/phenylalanyl-tRNA--protein transferase